MNVFINFLFKVLSFYKIDVKFIKIFVQSNLFTLKFENLIINGGFL